MKFKSHILATVLACGCLAAVSAKASFEYDFTPDNSGTGVSGSIFLDASSNPSPFGTAADIVSLSVTIGGNTYTEANIASVGTGFTWDPTMIDSMSIQLSGGGNIVSVLDGGISATGVRFVSGSWNAPGVPDAASTGILFIIGLGALGVWHWLRRSSATA